MLSRLPCDGRRIHEFERHDRSGDRLTLEEIERSAIATMFAHSLASMGRFGSVNDFVFSLFGRVPERCPAARVFSSLKTVAPEREEPCASEFKACG
jgi:hypothetical protein